MKENIPVIDIDLRDYFASKAMEGFIMKWKVDSEFDIKDPEYVAKMSYQFADAMIERKEMDRYED